VSVWPGETIDAWSEFATYRSAGSPIGSVSVALLLPGTASVTAAGGVTVATLTRLPLALAGTMHSAV
jgi:hypothetical protein